MAPTLSFSIVATGRGAAEEAAQDAKGSPATLGGAANPQGLTALLLVVAWVMRVGEQEEALGGGLHDLPVHIASHVLLAGPRWVAWRASRIPEW